MMQRAHFGDSSRLLIFAADALSQPHRAQLSRINPHIYTKCERPLAACSSDDLVVLSGKPDQDYYHWLRSIDLGPNHVISYHVTGCDQTLSHCIQRDPDRLLDILAKTQRQPVYIPYYSGREERGCANRLSADLFGVDEEIVLRYFNKISFKRLCRELAIPVLDDVVFELDFGDEVDLQYFKRALAKLGSKDCRYVVRGEYGSGGSSFYVFTLDNIDTIYQRMRENGEHNILIEHNCDVSVSPSDHWVITQDHKRYHVGITFQRLKDGFFCGSSSDGRLDDVLRDRIRVYSRRIVDHMQAAGYIGWIGLDYVVDSQGQLFIVENNARLCESTFAFGIVDRLKERGIDVPFWRMIRTQVGCSSFSAFLERYRSLIYSSSDSHNKIFPYDCGMLPSKGVLSLLLLVEDEVGADELEQRFIAIGREG